MSYSLDAILLGAALPERIATRIQILLGSAPAPEMAARFLERLRQESPSAFDRIVSSPAALRCAVNLFSYSSFLSEAVLRNPERLLQVANSTSFYRVLDGRRIRASAWPISWAETIWRCPRRWTWRASGAANCCASCCATCSASRRSPT